MVYCEGHRPIHKVGIGGWEFTDNDVEPSLNSVFENPSIDANRKVAMFAFYALKHREEMLVS